jgi:hypothetical protein
MDLFKPDARQGRKSLEFESTLWEGIGRSRPRRPAAKPLHKRYGTMAFLLAVALVALWAWFHGSNDNRAVQQMATTAFQWVRDGRVAPDTLSSVPQKPMLAPATVSAESRPDAASPWTSPEEGPARQKLLAKIRADVEAKGGRWADAKAVAFGGVRARVADSAGVATEVLMGNVYFVAGGKLFALELSAERVDDAYVPTDLWQCAALDFPPTDLKAIDKHATDCYQTFTKEPSAQGTQILDPKAVFITF